MELDRVEQLTAGNVMTTPAIACREEAFFEEVAELLALAMSPGYPWSTQMIVSSVWFPSEISHTLSGTRWFVWPSGVHVTRVRPSRLQDSHARRAG